MAVLSVIYWLADVVKFQNWGVFFVVFGINALFSYFLCRSMEQVDAVNPDTGG